MNTHLYLARKLRKGQFLSVHLKTLVSLTVLQVEEKISYHSRGRAS